MNNSSGNRNPSIFDLLCRLLGIQKSAATTVTPAQPLIPPDSTTEPVRIVTSRVLLVIYDPIMDLASGTKLSQTMKWNRPDDLANLYIQDIMETSGGLAR